MKLKPTRALLLCTLALAACGKEQDNKPILEKDRQTLQQAQKVDAVQQQNTQQQNQAVDQQTQ